MAFISANLGSDSANLNRVKQWVTLAIFSFPPTQAINAVIDSEAMLGSLAISKSPYHKYLAELAINTLAMFELRFSID